MTRNEINGRAAITLTGDLEKDLDEFSCNQDLTVIDSDGLEYTVRERRTKDEVRSDNE